MEWWLPPVGHIYKVVGTIDIGVNVGDMRSHDPFGGDARKFSDIVKGPNWGLKCETPRHCALEVTPSAGVGAAPIVDCATSKVGKRGAESGLSSFQQVLHGVAYLKEFPWAERSR